MLGLVATYWDDGWHTEIGRDDALLPPHLLLYASIGMVGLVLAGWVLVGLWRTRSLRATLAIPGLALAVAAGVVTAGAAPADAAWHAAFGRDSVLWSPPHLLSVIGTAVLVVAVLLNTGHMGSRVSRIALAVVLLGATEIVVVEYETDVPQFSQALYLPVLLAVGLGSSGIIRALVVDRAVVTPTVLSYLVFRLLILAPFAITGWTTPDVPIALLGLLVLDAPARWDRARWPAAGLAVAALQLVASASGVSSVPVRPTLLASVIVVPLLAATLFAVSRRPLARAGAVLGLLAATSLLVMPHARAHDPGQGTAVATAQVSADGDGSGTIAVRITEFEGTAGREWTPGRLVARRAGEVVTAPLVDRSGVFAGKIVLPSRGLWFIYAELWAGNTVAETWLPVRRDEASRIAARRSVYLPAGTGDRPAGEYLAGAGLLALGTALIGWAVIAVRRRQAVVHQVL
ncbi:hypothetical protein BAY60_18320 [Prauserella muralis]|uniref:Uncharacterized protein n=1 Tax=Prauserella muralis TaxID=588067 RepID=A0A2V4B2G9_9PSEU|nr:hypothetical protein BAY60_18320 [Prauserella muralis]